MRVDVSGEARAQILEIDAWWRENRPAAPDLFENELARVLTELSALPQLGAPYGDAGVRRTLLRRTQFHVYFAVDGRAVSVLAVWSCFRGRGPFASF